MSHQISRVRYICYHIVTGGRVNISFQMEIYRSYGTPPIRRHYSKIEDALLYMRACNTHVHARIH